MNKLLHFPQTTLAESKMLEIRDALKVLQGIPFEDLGAMNLADDETKEPMFAFIALLRLVVKFSELGGALIDYQMAKAEKEARP